MKDIQLMNLYPEEHQLDFVSVVRTGILKDGSVKINYGMNTHFTRRFITYKFEGYPEVYTINLMTDESTPAQMDKLFLSMVEYIQQQLITVDKETYLDLTDEGLEFYNFWINKFKGIKENVK
jgi:hypothetical protein